jgi:uncharacterized membrane protein
MAKAKTYLQRRGASKRLEFLTDGVFAIVATLLVLEIKVPELEHGMEKTELLNSLKKIVPSLVAFVFSFLNLMIFWINHDAIGRVVIYFNRKITYLNVLFLLFISLVPFTSHLVSEYPYSPTAISIYGIVIMLCSFVGAAMFSEIAFKSDMMKKEVSMEKRRKTAKIIWIGPFIFLAAILLGLIHVYIPVILYILTPIVFLFLPDMDLNEISDKENE